MPGAIQPHGRLIVADAEFRLVAWSENWGDRAMAASALAAVHATAMAQVAQLPPADAPAPLPPIELATGLHDVLAHRSGDYCIFEFEPAVAQSGTQAPIYSLARLFLQELHRAPGVNELAQLAAREMKRLTGFGRCLVYRFDESGHGEVLAERLDEGYDSYEGHHFPGADIPAQARELYRINRIRLIPDARYRPVALVGAEPGFDPRLLDLSWASLRSVSPVHLEYMVNMRTLASMSVSIVVRGKLWGLISCHHHEPLMLPYPVRAACEHLGQLMSLQVEAKQDKAEVSVAGDLRKLTLEIVSHLAESDATLQRLASEPVPLLRLASATGAAVVLDDDCWTVGRTPPVETLHALAAWVVTRGRSVLSTDRLPEEFAGSGDQPDMPAGLLAISISQVHRHVVMWFRPELVQTIQWAGDPRKEIRGSDGRIHPRRSFASWREQVRGRSAPWSPAEIDAADELRQALIGIVLRRAQEMAEVATELGRVNKELEAFSYTVSHDLRAPMRHIAGYVDLVLDLDGKQLGETSHRYLSHVKEASAYAGQLVDALLDFSRMGRSALQLSEINLGSLVRDLTREVALHEKDRAIEWELEHPLPSLRADPFLLQVAVRNLLANAVKYTRGRTPARIAIRGVRSPAGNGIEVSDNGVGFQMKYVNKLFGVFQRLHQAEEFEGTGIGLANVRRIVERHGGTVWARGEPGQGATFGFTLPNPEP